MPFAILELSYVFRTILIPSRMWEFVVVNQLPLSGGSHGRIRRMRLRWDLGMANSMKGKNADHRVRN